MPTYSPQDDHIKSTCERFVSCFQNQSETYIARNSVVVDSSRTLHYSKRRKRAVGPIIEIEKWSLLPPMYVHYVRSVIFVETEDAPCQRYDTIPVTTNENYADKKIALKASRP
jgi:hypothetical protein